MILSLDKKYWFNFFKHCIIIFIVTVVGWWCVRRRDVQMLEFVLETFSFRDLFSFIVTLYSLHVSFQLGKLKIHLKKKKGKNKKQPPCD